MPVVTKLARGVTYRREIPPINLHRAYVARNPQRDSLVRSHGKLRILYLQLQKTHRHQTRQGTDLP